MENHRTPLLSWAYFCQGKTVEELKHSLLCTTLELQQTKEVVQEEFRKRDDQLNHLKDLVNKAIKERDEAHEKCQRLLEKLLLEQQKQQTAPLSGTSSIEDEPRRGIDSNNGFWSSDCEESIVSSPIIDPIQPSQTQLPPQTNMSDTTLDLVSDKPLPEKGKLLQAVMKAGPLLQNLLLAGPLPQWRHPPPPLESFEIPPVTIPSPSPSPSQQFLSHDSLINITNCGRVNRKRVHSEGSESPTEVKYQRVVLH